LHDGSLKRTRRKGNAGGIELGIDTVGDRRREREDRSSGVQDDLIGGFIRVAPPCGTSDMGCPPCKSWRTIG
jgi:hypothetical protein